MNEKQVLEAAELIQALKHLDGTIKRLDPSKSRSRSDDDDESSVSVTFHHLKPAFVHGIPLDVKRRVENRLEALGLKP